MSVHLPPLSLRYAVPVAVASGALLWLAFPPIGAWPLALVGVALLSIATAGRSRRAGFALGLITGFAFYLPLLDWMQNVGMHAWIVLAVTQTLATGVLGLALSRTSTLTWWPLAQSCLWVAYEALRGRYPLGGFTWGRLAFSQSRSPLAPLAAVGGAPLVSFATAVIGLVLLWVLLAAQQRPRTARGYGPALAALIVIIAGSAAIPLPAAAGGRQFTVAAIQGNVPALGLDTQTEDLVVTRNHADATKQLGRAVAAGEAPAPDLVVWPESSSDIDPRRDDRVGALVVDSANAVNAPVLVGAVLDSDDGQILNAGLLWDPVSGPGQMYVKQHLVPFGEYVPWRGLLRNRVQMLEDYIPRNFAPGSTPGVLTVGGVRVGDVICFEVAYDGLVRDTVRDGAQLLVVQTNNATYMRGRDPAQTEQQLEMGRLRAIEHGRAVVIAATSGVSALIGPDGTTIARSGIFTQEQLVASLPVRSALTVADRVGAWPELLVCCFAAAAVVLAARGRRRGLVRSTSEEHVVRHEPAVVPERGKVS
ncbi:MAG: apolipoprotein N-acyltransferase [Mycobacteriales bacterium]